MSDKPGFTQIIVQGASPPQGEMQGLGPPGHGPGRVFGTPRILMERSKPCIWRRKVWQETERVSTLFCLSACGHETAVITEMEFCYKCGQKVELIEPWTEKNPNLPFAFVLCSSSENRCGVQPLTKGEYERQMSRPDATWRCPKCGGEAWYDDERSEAAQGVQ